MRKLCRFFVSRTNLVLFMFGLSVFICFGQNERLQKCGDNDHWCRVSNYQQIVWFSKCDAVIKTKDTAAIFECAQVEYTKIIEQNPNDWAAYFARGRYFSRKNPEQAISDLKKTLEMNPKFNLTYTVLASIYQTKGDYDEALRLLNKVIELDQIYASAYNNRGYLYRAKGDFNNALADFNKVVELKPKELWGYRARGRTYFDMGDFDKALADLRKTIELNPSDWENYYELSIYHRTRGENAKAEINCQLAKELKAFSIDYRKKIDSKFCSL